MTQEETVERALLEEADKLMTIEQKQVDALERISADQKRIDAQREAMADEIVAGQNIQTVEEGRRFARAWIITAAQHAANEAYYRKNRDEMFRAIKQAYRLLFDSQPIDVSDGIQETIAGHAAALGTLQAVVDEWANVCDPPPGAFSEDPTNEDGTADQVRERNRDTIATPPGPTPCAAVSYIERDDGPHPRRLEPSLQRLGDAWRQSRGWRNGWDGASQGALGGDRPGDGRRVARLRRAHRDKGLGHPVRPGPPRLRVPCHRRGRTARDGGRLPGALGHARGVSGRVAVQGVLPRDVREGAAGSKVAIMRVREDEDG